MQLQLSFATPIFFLQHPQAERLNRGLLQRIAWMRTQGERYRDRAYRDTQVGIFESNFDFFQDRDPAVVELDGFVRHNLGQVTAAICGLQQPPPGLEFDIDAWFHVTESGGFQGYHNHPNASWSGIYCVDTGNERNTPEGSGMVRFHDTRGNANVFSDLVGERAVMPWRIGAFEYRHEPGRMVVFPSYVGHEVFAHRGPRSRIIVAFNARTK